MSKDFWKTLTEIGITPLTIGQSQDRAWWILRCFSFTSRSVFFILRGLTTDRQVVADQKALSVIRLYCGYDDEEEEKEDCDNYLHMEQNEDALKIFKLNTELFPKGYNTYDSYGECLLKVGHLEDGLKAYKKSLELNPNNENARQVISQYEN